MVNLWRLRYCILCVIMVALLCGVAGGAVAKEKLPMPKPLSPVAKIKIAEDGSPSGAGFYIADAKGYFKELGIAIEFVIFDSGAKMLPAVAAGHVDVAGGITSVAMFNAIKRGLEIKVIGDKGTNIPGRPYYALVIRKDLAGVIKDYKDLKGRKLAVASKASLNELSLEKALKKGGLTIGDVDLIEMDSFSDMLTAMINRALDGAMQIEPLITKGEEDAVHVLFKDPSEYAPGAQIAITLASPQFVTEKKEIARRFMIAYVKGLRDYNDAFIKGKNLDAVIDIMVKYSTIKDPQVWRRNRPVGLNPDGYASAAGIAADLAWYREKGYFTGDVDLRKVVDHSLADYAVSVLGEYQ